MADEEKKPGGLTDTSKIELIKIPGTPKIWKVSNNDYRIVYTVPGTNPPVNVFYTSDKKGMEAIFGPDQEIAWDREVSADEIRREGALYFGQHTELANLTSDPITALNDQIKKEAEVRPWLNDPEVVQVLLEATLEGRTPTEAEFQRTSWWQSHNQAQRDWLLTNAADPRTAQQRLSDNRINARNALISAGVWEPDERLINYVADRFTRGDWSETFLREQISAVADPRSASNLDVEFKAWMQNQGIAPDTTQRHEDTVRAKAREWLGPAYGNLSQADVERWAGRLRNDPDAGVEFEKFLQGQRMALFPSYTDPTRTYDDIASGWRTVWQQEWGELPDETQPMFLDIVRNNDLGTAQQKLRTEGLRVGNRVQTQKFVGQLADTFNRTGG